MGLWSRLLLAYDLFNSSPFSQKLLSDSKEKIPVRIKVQSAFDIVKYILYYIGAA